MVLVEMHELDQRQVLTQITFAQDSKVNTTKACCSLHRIHFQICVHGSMRRILSCRVRLYNQHMLMHWIIQITGALCAEEEAQVVALKSSTRELLDSLLGALPVVSEVVARTAHPRGKDKPQMLALLNSIVLRAEALRTMSTGTSGDELLAVFQEACAFSFTGMHTHS
jgi:hypothetical protein